MSPKTKLSLTIVLIFSAVFALNFNAQNKGNQNDKTPKTIGVSVSPSHFHFSQKQGEVKTYDITVKNTTSTDKGV
jgi:hypothetical protein